MSHFQKIVLDFRIIVTIKLFEKAFVLVQKSQEKNMEESIVDDVLIN